MSFYVDIPQKHDPGSDDGSWLNVAVVATRREAEEILRVQWGIPARYSSPFIVEGDADLRQLYAEPKGEQQL